ncbi:MAG: apolipoprotein N-acyltransferase [Phycisphaerales bacterium]
MTWARPWIRPALLAALGSLLICLSVPPIGWWWLAAIAWAPLTLVAVEASGNRDATRRAVIVAFIVALGRWMWLELWIREVSDAGWPALAIAMACFDGLYAWAVARSEASPRQARWPLAARTAVLLVGCEWFRGRVFLEGYPWFMPAQPLIEWPLLVQGADLIGAAGMGLLPAALAGACADLVGMRRHARRARIGAIAAASLWLAAVAYGSARIAGMPEPVGALRVLAVQTNVSQSNKDAPDRARQDRQFGRLLELTVEGLAAARRSGEPVDLVAWPETIVPGFGFERDAILLQKQRGLWPADQYVGPVEALAERTGVPILLGSGAFIGLRVEGDRYVWDRQFNSGYLVRGRGDFDRVDKILLTPFGETMPYISRWKWLEQKLLDLGARGMQFNLNAGDAGRLLEVQGAAGTVRIGVPICFEDTVSRAVQAIVSAGEGASALVNLSNDGWFGDYLPGRAQHEQAARWRTIEHRVAMVRVANTGVTAAFDAAGRRIAGPLPPGTEGALRVVLPAGARGGLFTHTGDVASWTMLLASVVMMVRARLPRPVAGAARTVACMAMAALLCACGSKDGRMESWSSKQQSVTEDSTVALSKGPRVRPQLPVSASADPARNARQLLDEASRSADPMIRAIAIEAMEHDPTVLEPAVRRGLGDPNPGVRFCAAVVGSKAALPGLAPLVEPLLLDASPSVQAGAILALHRCGRPVDPTPLAAMVVSPSPEIRGNAVMVLGDLGNRTAMPLLKQGFETPMPRAMPAAVRVVDLQIAEAMVKLGDMSQLEPIHAALFSRSDQGECIALACQIVGTLRDKSSLPMLQRLIDAGGDDTRPLEIRLVAAIACMKILSPGPEALADLGLLGSQDKRPEVRALAARLLGWFQTPQAAASLSQLLRDRDPSVQISAAASLILQDAAARGRESAQR